MKIGAGRKGREEEGRTLRKRGERWWKERKKGRQSTQK